MNWKYTSMKTSSEKLIRKSWVCFVGSGDLHKKTYLEPLLVLREYAMVVMFCVIMAFITLDNQEYTEYSKNAFTILA